jgi:hypothetical protein
MEKKAKSIGVMTSDQAIQLRQLAFDAYEPDAFRPNLTRTDRGSRGKTETDGQPAARAVTMIKLPFFLPAEPSRTAWRFLFWTQIVRRK